MSGVKVLLQFKEAHIIDGVKKSYCSIENGGRNYDHCMIGGNTLSAWKYAFMHYMRGGANG
jgi:hypothetical protein